MSILSPSGLRLACGTLLLAALLVVIGPWGSHAALAEPEAITQAVTEADALRSRVAELNDKLGQLVEDYNTAGEQLEQTKAAATSTQTALHWRQKDLSKRS